MSCKSQKQTSKSDANDGLQLLVEDAYFPVENQEAMVIKDEKSLRSFFSKVNQTRKPGLPIPEIDFELEMAIIICAGAKKGNQMPYLKKGKKSDEAHNLVISTKRSDQEISNDVVIFPFVVYKMPIADKEIVFSWQ